MKAINDIIRAYVPQDFIWASLEIVRYKCDDNNLGMADLYEVPWGQSCIVITLGDWPEYMTELDYHQEYECREGSLISTNRNVLVGSNALGSTSRRSYHALKRNASGCHQNISGESEPRVTFFAIGCTHSLFPS